jgi:hypothetical protein
MKEGIVMRISVAMTLVLASLALSTHDAAAQFTEKKVLTLAAAQKMVAAVASPTLDDDLGLAQSVENPPLSSSSRRRALKLSIAVLPGAAPLDVGGLGSTAFVVDRSSLPLQSSLMSKTYLKSDHFNGGGSRSI